MNFNEYQIESAKTAIYGESIEEFLGAINSTQSRAIKKLIELNYLLKGLSGEAAEVGQILKKCERDHGCKILPDAQAKMLMECGDVLWYLSQICTHFDVSLAEVAEGNLKKLKARFEVGNG